MIVWQPTAWLTLAGTVESADFNAAGSHDGFPLKSLAALVTRSGTDWVLVTGTKADVTNANDSNDENILLIGNPDIAALYVDEFLRRWNEASDPDPADLNC